MAIADWAAFSATIFSCSFSLRQSIFAYRNQSSRNKRQCAFKFFLLRQDNKNRVKLNLLFTLSWKPEIFSWFLLHLGQIIRKMVQWYWVQCCSIWYFINQQFILGVYYIIHPNGVFQKVVYKTYDEPGNRQISTQGQYGNFAPIVEPIYTYDPRTFVLQRLILGSQS